MNPLFSNIKSCFGAFKGETDMLLPICPKEFFSPANPWGKAALNFAKQDPLQVSTNHWRWKTEDIGNQSVAKSAIYAIAASFWITDEEKRALAGWILSDVLVEVPA